MELILIFAFHGILSGLVYLAFCFFRRMTNYNFFASIPLDFATGLTIGLLFFRAVMMHTNGEVRLYFLLAFIVGLVSTLITFKNFVATLSDFVYNIIIKAIMNIKSTHKRRQQNGRTETSKNS